MRVLVFLLALVPQMAFAQQYLGRGEVQGLMSANVLCFHPDGTGACSWAELYNRFGDDSLYVMSASAAEDGTISVLEERLIWIGDALCLLDNAEGVITVYGSDDSRFDFHLRNIWDLDPATRESNLSAWVDGRPIEMCFRYARDPGDAGRLQQYTLIAGAAGKDTDPILLVPRSQGSVQIAPAR